MKAAGSLHTQRCRAAQLLLLSLPLQLLQDFPMFISLALDFVTHATAARWYHTTAPAYCSPLLSQRTPRTKTLLIQPSPWCRMQGLPGRGCVCQDNKHIFARKEKKKTCQIVWKLCLVVFWEDQHPEDFHLGSQQAQTKTHWTWRQRDLAAG